MNAQENPAGALQVVDEASSKPLRDKTKADSANPVFAESCFFELARPKEPTIKPMS